MAVEDGTPCLAPDRAIDALFTGLAEEICGPRFRGCPFINAAVEYPDPDHPFRHAVTTHRTWLRDAFAAPQVGTPIRGHGIVLVLLRDGAMIGGYVDEPANVRYSVHATVRRLVDPNGTR